MNGRKRHLVVFVHVPKTAGTTLTRMLRLNEPSNTLRIANVFRGGGGVARPVPYERVLRAVRQEKNAKLLYGHTPLGIEAYFPGEWSVRYITFLRNPIDRALSHYYQQLDLLRSRRGQSAKASPSDTTNVSWLTNDVPLDRAFSDLRYVPDNLHTRMLSGYPEPFGDVTREMLDRAKDNLRTRFVMFGLAERFDESLTLLKCLLGYRNILYDDRRVNASRPRADMVPDELIQAAERGNRYDIELYRFAEQLFDARPEMQQPEFQVELAALQKARSSGVGSVLATAPPGFRDESEAWRMLLETRVELLHLERRLGYAERALRARTERSEERTGGLLLQEFWRVVLSGGRGSVPRGRRTSATGRPERSGEAGRPT